MILSVVNVWESEEEGSASQKSVVRILVDGPCKSFNGKGMSAEQISPGSRRSEIAHKWSSAFLHYMLGAFNTGEVGMVF